MGSWFFDVGRTQRGVRGRRGRRGMPKRRPGMKKSPGGTLTAVQVPAMGDAAVPMLMQVDSLSGLSSCFSSIFLLIHHVVSLELNTKSCFLLRNVGCPCQSGATYNVYLIFQCLGLVIFKECAECFINNPCSSLCNLWS